MTKKFNEYVIQSLNLTFQQEQLIEQIRRMQSLVAQTAQMTALGQMAGGLAHEINNPMTIIVNATEQVSTLLNRQSEIAASHPCYFYRRNIQK